MTDGPVAVRVFCGAGCRREVGRVVITPNGPRYRLVEPLGPHNIIGGWDQVLARTREVRATIKELGGRPAPMQAIHDLALDRPAEDFGDMFPTYNDCHGRGHVDRQELLALVRQYRAKGGVPQVAVAIR